MVDMNTEHAFQQFLFCVIIWSLYLGDKGKSRLLFLLRHTNIMDYPNKGSDVNQHYAIL
jgi:hypothetical protein